MPDLKAFRAEEDAALTTYGWVDKGRGVARIPVEEAMRLLAERGLPRTAPEPSPSPVGQGEGPSEAALAAAAVAGSPCFPPPSWPSSPTT